jgi:AAA domain
MTVINGTGPATRESNGAGVPPVDPAGTTKCQNGTMSSLPPEPDRSPVGVERCRRADIATYLDAVFPAGAEGIVAAPVGDPPAWDTVNDKYKADPRDKPATFFEWPAQRDELIQHIADNSESRDVYLCPSLFRPTPDGRRVRKPYVLKESWSIGVDWDGQPADRDTALRVITELGAHAIDSGTTGHLQVQVPLAEPMTSEHRYREFAEAVAAKLPPGADHKKACNDLLRIAGTYNFKPTVRPGDTGQRAPTPFAIHPNGHRIDPDKILPPPVADEHQGEPRASTGASRDREPVALAFYPTIVEAIGQSVLKPDGGIDRSETTAKLINACVRAMLTPAQTRWVVDQRGDLAARLEDRPDDDILRCYLMSLDTYLPERFSPPICAAEQRDQAGGAAGAAPDDGKQRLRRAGQLEPMRQSKFLAKQRIPYAAVTLLCGDEGIGKSLLWVIIVAAVTTGKALPAFGIPEREPADVILIITEDNWSEDVLPRLTAAGTDLDRVHVISESADGSGSPTFPSDMPLITGADIKPALIVVDAWLDTVPGSIEVKNPQQSRAALHPWKDAATQTGAAVLLLCHTNRLETDNLRDKYGATASLRQKARMALFAIADPDDGSLLVGPDKANNTRGGVTASNFSIESILTFEPTDDHDGTVPLLEWQGFTGTTVKQHVAEIAAAGREQRRQPTGAEEFLRELLADGKPHAATELLDDGRQNGFTANQMKRAKDKIASAFQAKPAGSDKRAWYWQAANHTGVEGG